MNKKTTFLSALILSACATTFAFAAPSTQMLLKKSNNKASTANDAYVHVTHFSIANPNGVDLYASLAIGHGNASNCNISEDLGGFTDTFHNRDRMELDGKSLNHYLGKGYTCAKESYQNQQTGQTQTTTYSLTSDSNGNYVASTPATSQISF